MQSGSAVVCCETGKVVAIHKGTGFMAKLNDGVRITADLINTLKKWAKEMNCLFVTKKYTLFEWDSNTDVSNHFNIDGKKVTNKVEWDGSYYQMTGKHRLAQHSTTKFKIVKFDNKNSDIAFGIITEDRKN